MRKQYVAKMRQEEKAREKRLYIQQLIGCAVLGLIAACILYNSLFPHKLVIINHKPSSEATVVKVQADQTPFCYDPITCIRDVGQELNVPNQDIMTMIRIAKAESRMNPLDMGVNTNGTVDRGLFQINSCHKDLNNADAFDFQKNIRYAYGLFLKEGTTPWNSSKSKWTQ